MGSARRLRKLYEIPKKVWDSKRIEDEQKLIEDYGLRNMRELWRMQTILRKIRREARKLLASKGTGQDLRNTQLVNRVRSFMIPKTDVTLDDILALSMRDILERRLQTVVVRKGMAHTLRQARQLIVHGHIGVDERKSTSPSMLITFSQEAQVTWFGSPVKISEITVAKPAAKTEPGPAEKETEEAVAEPAKAAA